MLSEGHWTDWVDVTDCSVYCGQGVRYRSRECVGGGDKCAMTLQLSTDYCDGVEGPCKGIIIDYSLSAR